MSDIDTEVNALENKSGRNHSKRRGKGKRRDLSNQTQENVYTAKNIENFKTH